jgi:adenosylhomocysteine nucleosidase
MASLLVMAPQADEMEAVCRGLERRGAVTRTVHVGRLACVSVPALDMLVAPGGNGKAQFAVQAQHLLDHCPDAKLLLCVGAAGRLSSGVSVGDVVVGSCTIEHDYNERFVPEPLPCHECDTTAVGQLAQVAKTHQFPFRIHIGPIASGDEDIVDAGRAAEVFSATQALCVAWEGSGGARAARFSGVGFVEIRVITDAGDEEAAVAFHENLATVLPNAGELLVAWRLATEAT